MKKQSDTAEEMVKLLKHPWNVDPDELPPLVTPKGLSVERQWYLFEKIREFCPESDQDITCPKPSVPKPTSRAGTPADMDGEDHGIPTVVNAAGSRQDDDGSTLPPTKKVRLCGSCGKEGHNRRTCPDKE